MKWRYAILGGTAAAGAATAVHDLVQTQARDPAQLPGRRATPRFLLEKFGPELRQYIVTSNDEERPFSRDQRRWVYASSKLENNYFGFGTDNDVEQAAGYPIIKHRTFTGPGAATDAARAGGDRRCPAPRCSAARAAVRTPSGPQLGGQHLRDELRLAVGQGDRGAQQGRGDGRLPAEHRRGRALAAPPPRRRHRLPDRHVLLRLPRRARPLRPGAARGPRRSPRRCGRSRSSSARAPSPASAACCPGEKVSREIAEIRGIPEGKDCASPSRHEVFHDVDSMLDFVELVAAGDRPAGRHQVGGRQPRRSGTS